MKGQRNANNFGNIFALCAWYFQFMIKKEWVVVHVVLVVSKTFIKRNIALLEDDFVTISSGLVTTETTLNVYNQSILRLIIRIFTL